MFPFTEDELVEGCPFAVTLRQEAEEGARQKAKVEARGKRSIDFVSSSLSQSGQGRRRLDPWWQIRLIRLLARRKVMSVEGTARDPTLHHHTTSVPAIATAARTVTLVQGDTNATLYTSHSVCNRA